MAGEGKREAERTEAGERRSPSGRIVYQAILQEADDELERPSSALFWSALAAGLSMGFSLIAEGLLRFHLPDEHWRPLISKLGYSVGFLVVILGRQQLFTENTLTPILPLLKRKTISVFWNVARLWGIVFVGNLLGAFAVAWASVKTAAFEPELQTVFVSIGTDAMQHGFGATVVRGIFAGWLIALIVWLMPFAETARVWVMIFITYLVGLGEFSHIIAGSVEVFAAAWSGAVSWANVAGQFVAPTLIGNIIGGVTLVAAVNHAQVVAGGGGEDI